MRALETIGTGLNALFQHALRVGKRARAETGIDSAGRSVVSAGLEAVGGFEGRRALVVGAGSMASLAAQTLLNGGAASVTTTSATRGAGSGAMSDLTADARVRRMALL